MYTSVVKLYDYESGKIFSLYSTFRQIPDNQEVFTHPVRDQSIIIEIMEAANPQEPDETAIKLVHPILFLCFLNLACA